MNLNDFNLCFKNSDDDFIYLNVGDIERDSSISERRYVNLLKNFLRLFLTLFKDKLFKDDSEDIFNRYIYLVKMVGDDICVNVIDVIGKRFLDEYKLNNFDVNYFKDDFGKYKESYKFMKRFIKFVEGVDLRRFEEDADKDDDDKSDKDVVDELDEEEKERKAKGIYEFEDVIRKEKFDEINDNDFVLGAEIGFDEEFKNKLKDVKDKEKFNELYHNSLYKLKSKEYYFNFYDKDGNSAKLIDIDGKSLRSYAVSFVSDIIMVKSVVKENLYQIKDFDLRNYDIKFSLRKVKSEGESFNNSIIDYYVFTEDGKYLGGFRIYCFRLFKDKFKKYKEIIFNFYRILVNYKRKSGGKVKK